MQLVCYGTTLFAILQALIQRYHFLAQLDVPYAKSIQQIMDTENLRKKYILWSNIVDLRSRGINITRTAHCLGVSRDTVKHLQSLSSDELFRKYQESRRCKLQNYEQAVVSLLFTFPSTSSSRVHDYLKEHYPDFPNVCDKTVHNYVQFIRKKHHLPFRSCRL